MKTCVCSYFHVANNMNKTYSQQHCMGVCVCLSAALWQAPLLTLSLYYSWSVDGCTEEDESKKCNQHQRRLSLSEPLLFLILAFIFFFTPEIYIGSKYRLSVYLVCNNWYRYRHRPWKTHIGRPLAWMIVFQAFFSPLHFVWKIKW